jgi:hypothetical protein
MQKGNTPPRRPFPEYYKPGGATDYEAIYNKFLLVPGGLSFMRVIRAIDEGKYPEEYDEMFGRLIRGIFFAMDKAARGDEVSEKQLKAVEKLLYRNVFDVPASKIEEIATGYLPPPALVRAWELRRLMTQLFDLVLPAYHDYPHVGSATEKIRLDESTSPPEQKKELFKLAKKHQKRGMTLQSLAIKIYLEQLSKTGGEVKASERSLKRDLSMARQWDEANCTRDVDREFYFPYYGDGRPAKARKAGGRAPLKLVRRRV